MQPERADCGCEFLLATAQTCRSPMKRYPNRFITLPPTVIRLSLNCFSTPRRYSAGRASSPLTSATEHGYKQVVEVLLARGAQVNAVDGVARRRCIMQPWTATKRWPNCSSAKGANLNVQSTGPTGEIGSGIDAVCTWQCEKSVSPRRMLCHEQRPTSHSRLPALDSMHYAAREKRRRTRAPARSIRGRSRGRRFGWCHPTLRRGRRTRLAPPKRCWPRGISDVTAGPNKLPALHKTIGNRSLRDGRTHSCATSRILNPWRKARLHCCT